MNPDMLYMHIMVTKIELFSYYPKTITVVSEFILYLVVESM